MKQYVFRNILHGSIEIKIKADYYAKAMDLLLTVVSDIDDYELLTNPKGTNKK